MVAAARVSARLVSASGPVANSGSSGSSSGGSATARWRQAAAAAFSSNAASVLPGTGRSDGDIDATAAGAGGQRSAWPGGALGMRDGGGARSRGGGGRGRGDRGGGGSGGSGGIGGGGGGRGRRMGRESHRESGVTEGGASSDGGDTAGVEPEAAPPEVMRALASSHNTIALLLLLLLHFVATHIVGIMAMFLGTTAIIGLDQRLRSHADLQVMKSRFILVGVAVTAVLVVALSSLVLGTFPDGVVMSSILPWQWLRELACPMQEGLLRGLILATPKRDMNTIPTVIRTTIVVDLWARLFSVTVKAILALLVPPDINSSSSNGGRGGGLFCGGRYRVGWYGRAREDAAGHRVGEEGGGRAEGEEERASEGGAGGSDRTGVLLSRRRVYAMVEMTFMLYRSLLPVPAWLEFYGRHSEYFPVIYLVLKGMEASFRTDRLVRAACYVCRGDLDRGKFASPEEVAEAGSPDCSICYDRMEHPLLLPCQHLFCGECVAEWLDRERTCPLCRAEVPTSNPIPKSLRDGRTAILPQIL
eukprot:jgi/Undpi1/10640/HiC_scaffold_29.g13090.m1